MPTVQVTTLKVPLPAGDVANPNAVKVVTAADGRALYFSRAAIPFHRDASSYADLLEALGLYAYRRSALARFAALPAGALEQTERLEQLRLLENSIPTPRSRNTQDTIGVDTEEDLLRVEAILKQRLA